MHKEVPWIGWLFYHTFSFSPRPPSLQTSENQNGNDCITALFLHHFNDETPSKQLYMFSRSRTYSSQQVRGNSSMSSSAIESHASNVGIIIPTLCFYSFPFLFIPWWLVLVGRHLSPTLPPELINRLLVSKGRTWFRPSITDLHTRTNSGADTPCFFGAFLCL